MGVCNEGIDGGVICSRRRGRAEKAHELRGLVVCAVVAAAAVVCWGGFMPIGCGVVVRLDDSCVVVLVLVLGHPLLDVVALHPGLGGRRRGHRDEIG